MLATSATFTVFAVFFISVLYVVSFDFVPPYFISTIRSNTSCKNSKKNYVVANLPYYITTPIIVKLMKEMEPDKIVIMIQQLCRIDIPI